MVNPMASVPSPWGRSGSGSPACAPWRAVSHKLAPVSAELAPLQLTVGVRGGSQALGHAMCAGAASDDDIVTLQADLSNAFNTFSRDVMMKEVVERCSHWLASPGTSMGLMASSGSPGPTLTRPPVLSCAGVRQGDPLGPLLFAVVLQRILEHLRTHHPDAPCAAYAGDIILQGKPEAVRVAFTVLQARCSRAGLQVNTSKCSGYSCNHGSVQSVHSSAGVAHATRGPIVASTPLGNRGLCAGARAGQS